jgi:hypothetical protein
MGIFSKIGKGIKKVFSKIGRAIKKQFKRFGKFMNKIGVLGQIAMMFILPGIGNALLSGISGAFGSLVGASAAGTTTAAATSAATVSAGTAASTAVGTGTATAAQTATIKAGEVAAKSLAKQVGKGILEKSAEGIFTATRGTGMLGSSNSFISGAGSVIQSAGNFVSAGVKAFSTVTEGITSFMGEFVKTGLNKLGIDIGSAAPTFGDAWSNVQNNVMTNASETVNAFNKSIGYQPTTPGKIASYVPKDRITVAGQITKGVTPGLDLTKGPAADLNLVGGISAEAAQSAGLNLADITVPGPQTIDPFKVKPNLLEAGPTPVMDGVTTTPTTTPTTVTPKPKGFFAQIGENIADIPEKVKTSLLELPKKIGEIPETFVDNLTGTITDLPNLAARAALNRQPAAYIQESRVSIGAVPEFHMPQSEPLQTPEDYIQFYQNPQLGSQGNYGFNNPVGYSQFMKKFASAG